MNSHELAERLLKLPDCEIRFEEKGACWDSSIVNAFHRGDDNKIILRNWTNKRDRRKNKCKW